MKIVIDLDHTITVAGDQTDYENAVPNNAVVEKLREYRSQGFEIVIHTARNMRTHKGEIGKINVLTLPGILDWLGRNNVPYDEIIVGKPWCGHGGFYVDDKTIRPDEFASLSLEEVYAIVGNSSPQ